MMELIVSLLLHVAYVLLSNILVGVFFVWAVAEREFPIKSKLDVAKKAVCVSFLFLSCFNFLVSLVFLGSEVCKVLQ